MSGDESRGCVVCGRVSPEWRPSMSSACAVHGLVSARVCVFYKAANHLRLIALRLRALYWPVSSRSPAREVVVVSDHRS